jgi:hypothetical protein
MPTAQIRVDTCQVLRSISPYLTGACLEDVNHEVYGGIYSQMIFGERFEEEPMEIHPKLDPSYAGLEGTISCLAERDYLKDRSEVRTWTPFRNGTACGRLKATQQRARRGCRSQMSVEFTGARHPGDPVVRAGGGAHRAGAPHPSLRRSGNQQYPRTPAPGCAGGGNPTMGWGTLRGDPSSVFLHCPGVSKKSINLYSDC